MGGRKFPAISCTESPLLGRNNGGRQAHADLSSRERSLNFPSAVIIVSSRNAEQKSSDVKPSKKNISTERAVVCAPKQRPVLHLPKSQRVFTNQKIQLNFTLVWIKRGAMDANLGWRIRRKRTNKVGTYLGTQAGQEQPCSRRAAGRPIGKDCAERAFSRRRKRGTPRRGLVSAAANLAGPRPTRPHHRDRNDALE